MPATHEKKTQPKVDETAPYGRGLNGDPICPPGRLPDWRLGETCCKNESRDMDGWCRSCGCPCY